MTGTDLLASTNPPASTSPDGLFAFQQGAGSPFRPSGAEPLDLSPLNRTQNIEEDAW